MGAYIFKKKSKPREQVYLDRYCIVASAFRPLGKFRQNGDESYKGEEPTIVHKAELARQ